MAWQRKSSDSCFFCFPASSLTPYPQANIYLLQIIHLKSSAQKRQGCLPPWLHARHNDLSPNEDQWVPDFVLHQMCHTPILIRFYLVCLHESQIKTELHLEPGKPTLQGGWLLLSFQSVKILSLAHGLQSCLQERSDIIYCCIKKKQCSKINMHHPVHNLTQNAEHSTFFLAARETIS